MATRLQPAPLLLGWLLLLVLADGMLSALYVRPLAAWPTISWLADILTHASVPIGLAGLALWKGRERPADLGLRLTTRDEHGRAVLAVLLVSVPVVSVVVYALAVEVGDMLVPGSRVLVRVPSPGVIPEPGLWRILAIGYLGLSSALVAQLVYGAVVWRVLAPRLDGTLVCWAPVLFVAISGLLFGLTYWESGPSMMIATALFGTFTASIYRATGTIWPSVAGHAAVNLPWIAIMLGHA